MPIDPSISLGVQPLQVPNMLAMALQGQNLRNATLQGQNLQQTMASNSAQSQAVQQSTDPNTGQFDPMKYQALVSKNPNAAYGLQGSIAKNQEIQGQQIGNQQSQFKLHNDYANIANETAVGLLADPRISPQIDPKTGQPKTQYDPEQAAKALSDAQQSMIQKGVPPEQALLATAPFAMSVHNPGEISQRLKTVLLGNQSPYTQLNATTPQVQGLNTGGATQPIVITPSVGGSTPTMGIPGGAPNAPITNTLPPSTQRYNPATQQMEFVGQAAGGPQGQQQENQSVAASAPIGATGNIENNIAEMNRHYAGLQDQSSGAALIQSLGSNIKGLVPGAITGTEAGRQAYVTGLLNAMHLGDKATGDLQKDTDLLEKNMAQLTLGTPGVGRSDAGQMLIQAARPHGTMSAAAINEAVDQVSSQVKTQMAIRNALSPYKMANGGAGDALGYQQQRQKIEAVADPRIWQFADLPNKQAKAAFMAKQPDAQALKQKADQAVLLHLIQ